MSETKKQNIKLNPIELHKDNHHYLMQLINLDVEITKQRRQLDKLLQKRTDCIEIIDVQARNYERFNNLMESGNIIDLGRCKPKLMILVGRDEEDHIFDVKFINELPVIIKLDKDKEASEYNG